MKAIHMSVSAVLYICKRTPEGKLIPMVREAVDSIEEATRKAAIAYAAGADHCNVVLDVNVSDEDKQALREAAMEATAETDAANDAEPANKAEVIDLAKARVLGNA
jgi:hypothetical protein